MTARPDRWLAGGLVALGIALAANSLLGPLVAGVVTYPFSETLVNQTIGLEAVSLLVVAPWCLAAAGLLWRGHRAGPVAAIPPTGYTAYMFAQYVVGPAYQTYPPALPLHLGIFVAGWLLLAVAWRRIDAEDLPAASPRRTRIAILGLLGLAAFTTFRYLPAAEGVLTGAPLTAEFAQDPAMYWAIVLLDLGVVVPVTVAAAVGLRRGRAWAHKALYGVSGWFTLVPISVAAMGLVMLANDDPYASVGMVGVLSVAAVLFTGFAVWVWRPILEESGFPTD